MDIIVQIL